MTLAEEIALRKIKTIEGIITILKKEMVSLNLKLNEKLLEKGEKGDTGLTGAPGKDGKNADEKKIIKEVLKKIPKPENGKDGKTPDIKEVLDLIPKQDTEKLTKEIVDIIKKGKLLEIQDIRNAMENITNNPAKGKLDQRWHGSGIGRLALSETPTGSIDGLNKDFTLVNAPNPKLSLVLFLNGAFQTQNIDYTLSNKVISFVNAPQNIPGAVLTAVSYQY